MDENELSIQTYRSECLSPTGASPVWKLLAEEEADSVAGRSYICQGHTKGHAVGKVQD